MRLHLPIHYTVTGRLPGKRTTRGYKFHEVTEVEIADIEPSFAPVAVSWAVNTDTGRSTHMREPRLGMAGPDGGQHTRWYDGRHWVRLLSGFFETPEHKPQRRGVGPALTVGAIEALLAQPECGYLFDLTVPGEIAGSTHMTPSDPASRFTQVRQSTREEAFARASRITSRHIAVDGVVYEACSQPALRLLNMYEASGLRHDVVVETTKWSGWDPVMPLAMFDEAVESALVPHAYAVEIHRERLETLRPVHRERLETLRPVIHLPESISDEIEAVRRADYLVRRFADATKLSESAALKEYSLAYRTDAKLRAMREMSHSFAAWSAGGHDVSLLEDALATLEESKIDLLIPMGMHP
jgi:hypothetical protein